MLSLLLLAVAFGAGPALRSVWRAIRAVPRRNEDMIFY
jgi:hypothetical protein